MPTAKSRAKTKVEVPASNAIQPAKGKLGIMIPGMGAVATTFVAGVEAVRRGLSAPIGSLTQMGTIRLGKRTEGRAPKVKEFVPLAALDDLVFTGWDIFEDDMYTAATKAGVLERSLLDQIKPFLSSVKPRKAVFDNNYVKRLDGPNVKKGKNKMELAEQLRDDMRDFKKKSGASRLVTIWCGSTEIFLEPGPAHQSVAAFAAAERLRRAAELADQLGARPLAEEIGLFARNARLALGRPRRQPRRAAPAGPHGQGVRGAPPRRRRAVEPGDRRRAVYLRQDRQRARLEHPGQARREQPW